MECQDAVTADVLSDMSPERLSETGTRTASGAASRSRRTIAFFGHNSAESTVIKRAASFQAHGSRVIGFMFKRPRDGEREPTWENVELGTTADWRYAVRALKLLGALFTLSRHRDLLSKCQVFYARNIDMLFLAVLAGAWMRPRPVIVYEVLDVQTVFVGDRPVNRVFRWMERRLLARCSLLVVSSPDFVAQYFQPLQGYRGPWRLIENKVVPQQLPAGGIERAGPVKPGRPWVIGWFGNIRCVRGLEALGKIADTLGEDVLVYIRGVAPEVHLPARLLQEAVAARGNLVYGGPYKSPGDLAEIYGKVHFAWCVDYLDAGANSDWLLPNRIYEGGLMGTPAIARRDTATGRMVEREGLGWTFAEPLEENVIAFLKALGAEDYDRVRRAVDGKDRALFVDETDTRDLLLHLDALQADQQRGRR